MGDVMTERGTPVIRYVCRGSVRGECPHYHRTLEGAERCLDRDMRGCRKQGGYSDRRVVRLPDGAVWDDDAHEWLT